MLTKVQVKAYNSVKIFHYKQKPCIQKMIEVLSAKCNFNIKRKVLIVHKKYLSEYCLYYWVIITDSQM